MRKLIAGVVLALALPAGALAADTPSGPEKDNAARACRQERTAMGEATFKQTYGTNHNRSNAFGKCVSKRARAEHANAQNAAQQCRAEQADATFAASHGGKTFEQFYGTTANGRNAFGKCVSAKARAAGQQQTEDNVNAARTCRKERSDIGSDAFRNKYGTNKNKRNAFGKCVSKLAQAQGD